MSIRARPRRMNVDDIPGHCYRGVNMPVLGNASAQTRPPSIDATWVARPDGAKRPAEFSPIELRHLRLLKSKPRSIICKSTTWSDVIGDGERLIQRHHMRMRCSKNCHDLSAESHVMHCAMGHLSTKHASYIIITLSAIKVGRFRLHWDPSVPISHRAS